VWVDSQIGNCPPNSSFKEHSNPEFFCGKFLPLGNEKKRGGETCPNDFLEKTPKVVTLQGKKRSNLPDLEV
jgi:hypothetical protein